MITFRRENNPTGLALEFLESSIRHTSNSQETIDSILLDAQNGLGDIYILERDGPIAATYLTFNQHLLNIVLLGGIDAKSWRDDYAQFIRKIMRERGVKYLCVLGRRGWHGIFPELKPLGMLYAAEDSPEV